MADLHLSSLLLEYSQNNPNTPSYTACSSTVTAMTVCTNETGNFFPDTLLQENMYI
jgi:hypothetical protein